MNKKEGMGREKTSSRVVLSTERERRETRRGVSESESERARASESERVK